MASQTKNRRESSRVGVVKAVSGENTVRVLVSRRIRHSQYKKVVDSSRSYIAHNPNGLAKVGDKVKIVLVRPMSKTKSHLVKEVITSGNK